ncbi:MAG: OmpH family outer membrane protein [Akkermansiaceae bacterium]|nr:OmpH family outer membrane protein [Akkermansiaceae bacterium]
MNPTRRFIPAIFSLLLMAAVLAPATATAQDKLKIATVDIQELFSNYHRTKEAQQQIEVERGRIQKDNDERLERIRELEDKMQKIAKQLEDTTISLARKNELNQEHQLMYRQGIQLDRERREFLKRKNQALNEKLMDRRRAILEEIRELVEEKAKVGDYDYVFDKSGLSTSQVPFLLYTKDANDMTADILKDLNKDAPAEEADSE